MKVRTRAAFALVLSALSLAGCESMPAPADLANKPAPGNYVDLASHNKLLDHPSPAVAGPAGLGLGIGTIIGIPVMIVALPFTLGFGIAAFSDDPKVSNLEILGNAVAWPDAICAVGGCYALGSLPYMIVGPAPGRGPTGKPLPSAPVAPSAPAIPPRAPADPKDDLVPAMPLVETE